jgi:hypothetical protein
VGWVCGLGETLSLWYVCVCERTYDGSFVGGCVLRKLHTTLMIVKRWMKCVHDDAAHFEIKGDTRKDKDKSKLCSDIE